MMDKKLFDICLEILSSYLHLPEVNDTVKSIGNGLNLLEHYPQDDKEFCQRSGDIITYILNARADNIIYQCQEGKGLFLPVNFGGKTLFQDNRIELRIQLEKEIIVLIKRYSSSDKALLSPVR